MKKDIRVIIIDDDPYARDLMALLLTRDWRTRVVGEFDNEQTLEQFTASANEAVDVAVLDTDISWSPSWHNRIRAALQTLEKRPRILYTGTRLEASVLREAAVAPEFGGYALKCEILYGLAAGIGIVAEGGCVVTPGVQRMAQEDRVQLPENTRVLDGTKGLAAFTQRESEIVRLGILFNLAQRDVADELVLSPEWVSEVVSTAYAKLGLREILSGEVPLESYFDDPAILARWRSVIGPEGEGNGNSGGRKTPWMATLAYHILTMPQVTEI